MVFFTPKNVSLSYQKYRFRIRDPEKTYSGSRIQGQKGTDPGLGSASLTGSRSDSALSLKISTKNVSHPAQALQHAVDVEIILLVPPHSRPETESQYYSHQCCGSGSVGSVLGLLDPDPLVRGTYPDPLSSSKNSKKKIYSYCLVTSFLHFMFEK